MQVDVTTFPYNLTLSNQNTEQYAEEDVFVQCSGAGGVVNLPAISTLKAQNAEVFCVQNSTGALYINSTGTDRIYDAIAGTVSTQVIVSGAGASSHLKPVGTTLWRAN